MAEANTGTSAPDTSSAPPPDTSSAPPPDTNSAPPPDTNTPPPDNVVWPDTWREGIARGDEKKLARLGRFDGPDRIFDSYLEMEQRYQSANIVAEFPADGDDEAKAGWRKAQGVPADPSGYYDTLPEDMQIDKDDRAGFDILMNKLHETNASPQVAAAATASFFEYMGNAQAAQAEQDTLDKVESDKVLGEAYGPEMRRNMNDLKAVLNEAGVEELVLKARGPDGKALGNNPEFVRYLVGQMRQLNPLVTVPGLGGGDPAANLETEIKAIENTMATDFRKYQADSGMQARYTTLLEARNANTRPGR